jgi:ketosteroid isomerase-like protein
MGRMRTTEQPVGRKIVDAFFAAYAERDGAKLRPFLAKDVQWSISGPVDLLQFCGMRQGPDAVIELIERLVPEVLLVVSFKPEMILVDGDCALALSRVSARRTGDGRTISYRVAQFLRFRDGQVTEYCSVIDSFDAAEQVLGQHFGIMPSCDAIGQDALVVV